MNANANTIATEADVDMVTQVLGQLLRQPEPQRDIELERALLRLQAARSDAAYVLMHRVMVLEAALQQLKAGGTHAGAVPGAVAAASVAARPPSRSFLRDAAVVAAGVTAGVVAGQVLFQGLQDAPDADANSMADAGDSGDLLGIDGWL